MATYTISERMVVGFRVTLPDLAVTFMAGHVRFDSTFLFFSKAVYSAEEQRFYLLPSEQDLTSVIPVMLCFPLKKKTSFTLNLPRHVIGKMKLYKQKDDLMMILSSLR